MSTLNPIYLDNNSTTRVDSAVLDAMLPYLTEHFGNSSSSSHVFGQIAEKAVVDARQEVANLLGCRSQEIVFTSGATEANNLAILGAMRAASLGSKLIITAAEHKAVLDPAQQLEVEGYNVCVLPVDRYGCVSVDDVASAIDASTKLVSIMHGNNEVGSINPIREIAELCKKRGVLFHSDATQTIGKIGIDLQKTPVDLMSLSAHKMYGPKGIGALFVRRELPRINLVPLVFGGGHERKLRSGTLPVHQIVGLGKACSVCAMKMNSESNRIATIRDLLKRELANLIPGICFNGHPTNRLPGNLHVSIPGANSEAVMMKLRNQLAISSGSACTTSSPEPSHVLQAIGLDAEYLTSSLRFGVGRFNSQDEARVTARLVAEAVESCRVLSGFSEKKSRNDPYPI
jgi:cysteine desulfurase